MENSLKADEDGHLWKMFLPKQSTLCSFFNAE